MLELSNENEGYDIPHPLWDSINREKTFEGWCKPYIDVASLAHAGFIFVGPSDRVKCVFCYLMIEDWQPGDDPFEKHIRLAPDCSHAEYLLKEAQNDIPESDGNIVGQHPANPQYQNLEVRKETFKNWPRDHPIAPNDLAASGFFYTKVGDKVQCFHCNLCAEQWSPTDDVFVEHSRLNPKCLYMLSQKGEKYIQQCNPGATATEPSIDFNSQASNLRQVEIMRDMLSFQGYSSIYIDCAFLQQKLKKEVPITDSGSLVKAIKKLPRAEEAITARLKHPNRSNSAEITLMKSCKICLQRESEFICSPCEHYTCCKKCKDNFNKCPVCDEFVNYTSIDVNNLDQNFSNLDL